jgi:hypothetical protein
MPVSSATSARVLVYNAVVEWLGPRVGLPPNKIDVTRKFAGPPPGGYGQTGGSFMTMCNDISATLSVMAGKKLTLTNPWRVAHQGDVIAVFINAVAVLLIAAPMSPTGKKSLTWAMEV